MQISEKQIKAALSINLSSVDLPAYECLNESDVREIVEAALSAADPVAFVCPADMELLAKSPDGWDFSMSPKARPDLGMNMALYAAPRTHMSKIDPVLWVSAVDLKAWEREKAGEIWAWSENLEGQCIPLYASPPAPSVVVKAWTTEDEAREYRSFSKWFKDRGYPGYPEQYSLVCENAMHAAWQEAAKRTALTAQVQDVAEERYRHKKRGSIYTVKARGRLQVDGDLDNEKVVIYRGEDGQTWVRPEYEFNDGRFEPIPAAPAKQEGTVKPNYVAELVKANEELGVALSEAEQREKDARVKALDEAAKVADDQADKWQKIERLTVYEEKYAASTADDASRDIAAAIRALKDEVR